MRKKTQAELVANLEESEGYKFRDFIFTQEGNYTPSDADWNYKDVPHLTEIHQLVEACPAVLGDDLVSAILTQKIFGFKFPVVISNYQSGPNRQTYFISFFFFLVIIETTFEEVGYLRTRVNTKYCIGARPPFMIFFPLIKYALRRNYHDLMSGDIPMRERRGLLRRWGYSFKGDQRPYSFLDTTKLHEQNVIDPPDLKIEKFEIKGLSAEMARSHGILKLGRDDSRGLTLSLSESKEIMVFSRLCSHEGASLDGCVKAGHKKLRCPWHGKEIGPVFSFHMGKNVQSIVGKYKFSYEEDRLEILVGQASSFRSASGPVRA